MLNIVSYINEKNPGAVYKAVVASDVTGGMVQAIADNAQCAPTDIHILEVYEWGHAYIVEVEQKPTERLLSVEDFKKDWKYILEAYYGKDAQLKAAHRFIEQSYTRIADECNKFLKEVQ